MRKECRADSIRVNDEILYMIMQGNKVVSWERLIINEDSYFEGYKQAFADIRGMQNDGV